MGRWSQKRRSAGGGGGGGAGTPNRMVSADIDTATTVEITYRDQVDAVDFQLGDWLTVPSTITNSAIGQLGPRALFVTFEEDLGLETALDYFGIAPGVLTPQTIALT